MGMLVNPNGFSGAGVLAISPIIWNAADKSTEIALSEAGKLASKTTASTWGTARSTTSFSTGGGTDFAFEVEIVGDVQVIIGLANAAAALTNFIGSDANGWGLYAASGQKLTNASGVVYVGSALSVGDKVKVTITSAGVITFYINGVSPGAAYTGVSGTLFPAVSVFTNGVSAGRAT